MFDRFNRRHIIGVAALIGIVLVLLVASAGLFRSVVVEEARRSTSRVTRIVRDMNGYRVYWSGSADMEDIVAYDVQVCELPCEGWRDWKVETSAVSAWFGPDEGKHFGFRVRAHDRAGQVEPWPVEASMTTRQARQP